MEGKIKEYPEERKEKLNRLLKETEEARKELDDIDAKMRSSANPTGEQLKEWARKATGWGNYLRKKYKVLAAACINEKDARYMEIKFAYAKEGIKGFTDSGAKIEAEGYIAPLRTVRDILESYVTSAENIVSTVRLHFYEQQQEKLSLQNEVNI